MYGKSSISGTSADGPLLDTLEDGTNVSIFGKRRNREYTQVLNVNYIFTNRMSLSTPGPPCLEPSPV